MTFSKKDKEFMKIALEEAVKALKKGNIPIGAVLVANDKIIGKAGNSQYTEDNWVSHAETKLIREKSGIIRKMIKNESFKMTLYSTLEPCLMCFGAAVFHRIDRIVFACPDPFGGATDLNQKKLKPWYKRRWPKIKGGLFRKESYNMLINYFRGKKDWVRALAAFEEMGE